MKDFVRRIESRVSAPANRLGILRAATGLGALVVLNDIWRLFSRNVCLDPGFYAPRGLIEILFPHALSPAVADLMFWFNFVCGIFFALGCFYRVFGPVFSLGFLTTISYHFSWSYLVHQYHLLTLMVLVLGFSSSADGFSLDAKIRQRHGHPRPIDSPAYGLPICLILAITAATYFLAGVAKVLGPAGFAWATGENLRLQVAAQAMRQEVTNGATMWLTRFLAGNPVIFSCLAAGSLVIELAAPLFFLNGRARRVWAVCAWCMHLGIYVIMGISFYIQLMFISFLPCFDVERIPSALKSLVKKTNRKSAATAAQEKAPQKVASLR